MNVEQSLQKEIEESKRWVDIEKEDSTYKRDLIKRIELMNWVIKNMNNSNSKICDLIESRMNKIVLPINQTHDMIDADKLHSESGILDWIFYQVCKDQQKKLVANL